MNENQHNISNRVPVALGLITLGMMSLMSFNLLWPMIILMPGLMMLGVALLGGRTGAAAFSIPGMLVSGLGGLLFIQNWTGYWTSWAYAWTLFGVFLGMGFTLMGQRLADRSLQTIGRGFVYAGLFAFAGFAIFFELIIGISGGGGSLGALVLISVGSFLLWRNGVLDGLQGVVADQPKTKRKTKKAKRDAEALFTGPVVYGSRATARAAQRLTQADDAPVSDYES